MQVFILHSSKSCASRVWHSCSDCVYKLITNGGWPSTLLKLINAAALFFFFFLLVLHVLCTLFSATFIVFIYLKHVFHLKGINLLEANTAPIPLAVLVLALLVLIMAKTPCKNKSAVSGLIALCATVTLTLVQLVVNFTLCAKSPTTAMHGHRLTTSSVPLICDLSHSRIVAKVAEVAPTSLMHMLEYSSVLLRTKS